MTIGRKPQSGSDHEKDPGAVINRPPSGSSGGVFGRSSEGGGSGGSGGSSRRPGCPLPLLAVGLLALTLLLLARGRQGV